MKFCQKFSRLARSPGNQGLYFIDNRQAAVYTRLLLLL